MNVEALMKVVYWLENGTPEVDFNMNYGIVYTMKDPDAEFIEKDNICKTTCCIAGYVAHTMNNPLEDCFSTLEYSHNKLWAAGKKEAFYGTEGNWTGTKEVAMDILGLEYDVATELFENYPLGIAPNGAAKVIRNLIETGKVDWSIAK